MIVNQNITAKRIANMLGRKESKLEKDLRKLGLGQRISCAADDAAGLAISEKMRAQIRGLDQAIKNCEDGKSFLQTGEGALIEVEEELQRMRELAVDAANGTKIDSDRSALQSEFASLGQDIDYIGKNTQYNTIPVFQYDEVPPEPQPDAAARTITALAPDNQTAGTAALTRRQVIDATQSGEFNIFYEEAAYDFVAAQTPNGTATDTSFDAGANAGICDVIEKQIVPNVVEQILDAYPAFNYLKGSSIGIGLKLYSTPGSPVLASVSAGVRGNEASYTLSINMATVNLSSPNSRVELEQTIAHEMIHAFMDEATTNGMLGSDKFPMWFIEGMAQTASGPDNWVSSFSGLGLSAASTAAAIQTALTNNSLSSNTSAAQYGTGYLACMYLGYKANGGGAVTATGISAGLSKIMAEVIDGKSLDAAFATYVPGSVDVANFAANFANDPNAHQFVKDLLTATGSGAGGLVSKNLTAVDLVADTPKTNVKLFAVNTANDTVKNDYSGTGVTVMSGGGTSTSGVEPVVGYNPLAPAPPTPIVYPNNLFQVNGIGGIMGNPSTTVTDPCYFDPATGILTIQAAGSYTIKGGSGVDASGNPLIGQIVVAPGITNVDIKFDGITIDQSTVGSKAAMSIGQGSKVDITLLDGSTNTLVSGTGKAGLEVGDRADLTIKGDTAGTGKLVAKSYSVPNDTRHGSAGIGASFQGKSGKITITGGDITATGSYGGAGIGASDGGSVGDIAISGGTIIADSPGHGAGIGGGWGAGGHGSTSNGAITITGGTISATSATHGTGIGAGCAGASGSITISNATIKKALGGDGGAGIGASSSGSCGNIIINAGTEIIEAVGGYAGAGIGSGRGQCGEITINGGIIRKASGGDYGAGIGAGQGGTCGKIEIINGDIQDAKGGKGGAGIGAGQRGKCGEIIISGGKVTAEGGQNGAGIGAGERGQNRGDITISGGTVYAKGGNDGTGIGGGRWSTAATGTNIKLTGGVVTALGDLNPPGHNIGMFTDSEHKNGTAVPVEIGATTIQAGVDGEGKYNTTGAKDSTGVPIYAYPLDISAVIAPLTVSSIASVGAATGKVGSWTGSAPTVIPHLNADGTTPSGESYTWMSGEDQMVTVTLSDGNTIVLDLVFYPDAGVFRPRVPPGTVNPPPDPPPAVPPGNPSDPDPDIPPPIPPNPPNPVEPTMPSKPTRPSLVVPLPEPEFEESDKGLILQIGANSHQIMILQQFWLSMRSLGLLDIDISTQEHAEQAVDKVNAAIERVSGMRSTYGALSNRLDHVIANNENISLNLSQTESRIRDTDMAQSVMSLQITQIQMQAAQSMLAQANQLPQQVLNLLE